LSPISDPHPWPRRSRPLLRKKRLTDERIGYQPAWPRRSRPLLRKKRLTDERIGYQPAWGEDWCRPEARR
jgi:hypothetical protein